MMLRERCAAVFDDDANGKEPPVPGWNLPDAVAGGRGDVLAMLTPRETEVASAVARGLPNKYIARALGISPWTVSSHLRQIFVKLGIGRRIELVLLMHEQGLRA